MDASYKIQRGIHVHLIQFFMCPEFWVHIISKLRFQFRIYFILTHTPLLSKERHPWFDAPPSAPAAL